MKYKTISVTTNHESAELVSSAMFDVGAQGVSILDKQDFLDLIKSDVIWDYVDENLLTQSDAVKVSTVVDPEDTDYEIRLEQRLQEMKEYGVNYGEIVVGEVDEQDWANEWKKYYKPIVTPQITVVPTWINYTPATNEKIMRLDPGMAFGTGEHATTRMCLELMDVLDKTVIDVGCGSGILCQRHVISCSFAICSPWIYVWQIHLYSCGSVWWHGDYEFDFCIFAILLVDVLSIACGWICCTATVQYVCKQ